MQANGNPHNKSTINFSLFEEDPVRQQPNIYVSQTQMSDLLRNDPIVSCQTQTKFYSNKIFNSSKKYQVPSDSFQDHHQHKTHHQFYLTHHRFVKPYADHTKFTDSLVKNKHLLRRAQFGIPIQTNQPFPPQKSTHQPIFKPKHSQSNHNRKKDLHLQKYQPKKSSVGDLNKSFENTLGTHLQNYQRLMSRERSRKDDVGVQNSMNRILGAEMINNSMARTYSKIKTLGF